MYTLTEAIYIKMRKDLYSEISKMRSHWKYLKATICRHMKKKIGDLMVDLRKNNQGRPPKLSVQ